MDEGTLELDAPQCPLSDVPATQRSALEGCRTAERRSRLPGTDEAAFCRQRPSFGRYASPQPHPSRGLGDEELAPAERRSLRSTP